MNLAVFFDHIGLIVFIFITLDALFEIKSGKTNRRTYLRFFIGVGGLLADGYIVFFY